MDWASHGGVISKLPAHVLVVLGHLAREGMPDLAGRAKPSGVEGSKRSTVMRGTGRCPRGEEGFPCLFEQSRDVLPRGSS